MAPANHIVSITFPETSHFRFLYQLSLNLLELHPSLIISLLISEDSEAKFHGEQKLQPKSLLERTESRFKLHVVRRLPDDGDAEAVIAVTAEKGKNIEQDRRGFLNESRRLLEGQGEGRWVTVPCLFLVDWFYVGYMHGEIHKIVRQLGLPEVPVWHSNPSTALSHLRLYGGKDEGGVTEGLVERVRVNQAKGMSDDDAQMDAFFWFQGRLLEYPSLPPMYDFEYGPQIGARKFKGLGKIFEIMCDSARKADGWVMGSIPELEQPAMSMLEKAMGMPLFGVGPQFNDRILGTLTREASAKATDDDRIMTFLDDALKKFGPHCAVYISLGSWMWPTERPILLDHIIESLLEMEPPMPFILKIPAENSGISDELVQKVKATGKGILTTWSPQVRVLQHEATCAFLTHCGVNSIMEAVVTETPIIALPFGIDQPVLAAQYCRMNGCGVQLYQLSSGHDGHSFANGVKIDSTPENMRAELKSTWTSVRGAKGDEYRKNIAKVKSTILKSMDTGEAKKTMKGFSDYFTQKE